MHTAREFEITNTETPTCINTVQSGMNIEKFEPIYKEVELSTIIDQRMQVKENTI